MEEPKTKDFSDLNVTSLGNLAHLVLYGPLPFRFLHLSAYAIMCKCYKPDAPDKRTHEVLQPLPVRVKLVSTKAKRG